MCFLKLQCSELHCRKQSDWVSCVFYTELTLKRLTAPESARRQCGSRRRRATWQCWGAGSAGGWTPRALSPPAELLENWPCSDASWWTWRRTSGLCSSLCIVSLWRTAHLSTEDKNVPSYVREATWGVISVKFWSAAAVKIISMYTI